MTNMTLPEIHKAMIPRVAIVPELSLTIPANPCYTFLARKAVDAFASALQFDPDERQQIYLAVSEAVANAIRSTVRTVSVLARQRPDGIEIEIRNTGEWEIPADSDMISEHNCMPGTSAECGRGIPLMYITMDAVEFFIEDGETCVRLFKHSKH